MDFEVILLSFIIGRSLDHGAATGLPGSRQFLPGAFHAFRGPFRS